MTAVRRTLGDYFSPRFAFVDTHEPARPLVWVIGSQRSGTTWVAEMINPRQQHRLVFEPFHTLLSRIAQDIGLTWGQYVAPETRWPELAAAVDRIARGRVRDPWTDLQLRRRWYRSRLIKDVSATNLVPWLAHRRPDDRVLLVIRHPFAVASSLAQLAWRERTTEQLFAQPLLRAELSEVPGVDDFLVRAREDDFVRFVLKWCFENALPLRAATDGMFTVVQYEDLVQDPAAGVAVLGVAPLVDPHRPSATDYLVRSAKLKDAREELVTGWQTEVTPDQVAAGLDVLAAFGLDDLYGRSPWPLRRSEQPPQHR